MAAALQTPLHAAPPAAGGWAYALAPAAAGAERPPGASRHANGLILCRRHRGEHQALLVRGRCSYAFVSFVHGRYRSDHADAALLLRHMSVDERLEVCALDFPRLWARVWPVRAGAEHRRAYAACARRFAARWLRDSGAALRRLAAAAAGPGEIRWEFPKGGGEGGESDLACALRELGEETGVLPRDLLVLPGFSRLLSYRHRGGLYSVRLFAAVLRPGAAARPEQALRLDRGTLTAEVADIRWMGGGEIAQLPTPLAPHLAAAARAAFNYLRHCRRA